MLEGLVSQESFMDMSALERLKWVQQQQQQVVSQSSNNSPELLQILQFHGSNNDELLQSSHVQMLGSGCGPNYNMGFGSQNDTMDGCISRTSSCHMESMDAMGFMLKNNKGSRVIALKNKRKQEVKTGEEEKTEKKIKVEIETESSMKGKSNMSITEASSDTSKETSKGASENHKLDYIHLRACRGQATDRHSLAERARREKISKKIKYLQDIVPTQMQEHESQEKPMSNLVTDCVLHPQASEFLISAHYQEESWPFSNESLDPLQYHSGPVFDDLLFNCGSDVLLTCEKKFHAFLIKINNTLINRNFEYNWTNVRDKREPNPQ